MDGYLLRWLLGSIFHMNAFHYSMFHGYKQKQDFKRMNSTKAQTFNYSAIKVFVRKGFIVLKVEFCFHWRFVDSISGWAVMITWEKKKSGNTG